MTMATLAKPARLVGDRGRELEQDDSSWGPVYRIGGWAALAAVALVLINAPVLMLNPIPTTVLGHFQQIQRNKIVGLIDLDLMFLISQLLFAAVYVALFGALHKVRRLAATLATGIGLSSILLYIAVNPTFSFLYLSDQYAAATTEVQRTSLLAAGEAVWANYQGTGFGIAYVLGGVAILMFAFVMLRSHVFNRPTGYVGMVLGILMLVPPLPALGTFAVVVSYLSLLPVMVWEALVGWRLLVLARLPRHAVGGE
jgi:hypothetical protein